MAATLNSFLGNLDKIPEYIDECKKLNIEILKPDINKSSTKFTVKDMKIRFGLGSIKNVGIAAVETICEERRKNGEYKNLSDFCERISKEAVNKKCIESLIKSGAFDNLGETRATLLNSYELILDTITNSQRKSLKGQVSMFDLTEQTEGNLDEIKYQYTALPEFSTKELLSMEKEMIGIYISGHPLENLREQIMAQTNINTIRMREINEQKEEYAHEYKDGQNVTYAGIITSVKKKYTKKNTLMAFVTVEDLYGTCEIIVFDACYQKASNILIEDNIVIIDGRLSIREDEETKIVANSIHEFTKQSKKILSINITDLPEEVKDKLRGFLKFFMGEKSNIQIQIQENDNIKPAGGIYLTDDILKELQNLLNKERVKVVEI